MGLSSKTKPDPNPGGVRLEKHKWIVDHVGGRTFADIGGLWGTVNETVTIAALNGASETTMIDIQRESSEWWAAFHDRCASLNVSGYNSIVADICRRNVIAKTGQFDVTHCSGILYHVPDPIGLIRNLISITRERFILSSMLVPSRITNEAGSLDISVGEFHCVPILKGQTKAILATHFDDVGVNVGGVNGPDPRFISTAGHLRTGPWWYLFTAETMIAMCEMFDVTIEKTWISKKGAQSILARINRPD